MYREELGLSYDTLNFANDAVFKSQTPFFGVNDFNSISPSAFINFKSNNSKENF